jgi:cytochrome c-type biogenesis protein CcmH/NrfG
MTRTQWIVLGGAGVLAVLLYLAPNQRPLIVSNNATEETDAKVAEAIQLVQSGTEPMKGIMLLREVLEKDSNNVQAHFYLGTFSIQSQQFDKAVTRFERVLKLDPARTEAWFYLGVAWQELGDADKAIECLEKYKASTDDPRAIEEVGKHINEIKNS